MLMTLMPVMMAAVMTVIPKKKVISFFSLKILTQALDDPFAEVGSDIDLETGDALGGDGGDGGGDAGGKI